MMQKKILVLAVAVAIAAPVAFADTANVTVYGQIAPSFESVSNGSSAAGVSGATTNQISSNATKVGLKGSGDLGDGLSVNWQIEQQIDIDNSTSNGNGAAAKNSFATRNTFAGLKGESWGTLILGRHDTPYKIATRGLDVFGDTIADNRTLMGGGTATGSGGGAHDARPTDVFAYISPAINDFTITAAYVAGAEQATLSTQTKGGAWSLAGMYKAGPINASLAYQAFDYGSALTGQFAGTANNKFTATKLGGGYTMDALQLNAVYERTSYTNASGAVDTVGRTDWYFSGKYSLGSDAIKLAYAKASNSNNLGAGLANGAKQISIGYDHSLNKSAYVYALYTKVSNDTGASYTLSNAGSTAGAQALPGAGASPSALALGMKYSF